MNENIGKRYSWGDKSGTHRREIIGIGYQGAQRIYETKDLDTGEPHTAHADEVDRQFFPKSGQVIPKGYKGKTIRHKQRNY